MNFDKLNPKKSRPMAYALLGLWIIFIIWMFWLYDHRRKLLDDHGKITIGKVIERQHRRKSDRYVICEYYVKQTRYTQDAQVNYIEGTNNILFSVGDSLIIVYLPEDPKISVVDLENGKQNLNK